MEMYEQLWTMVIIPLLCALSSFLIVLIRNKTAELKQEMSDATAQKYLSMAEESICTAVVMINQVYVQSLKEQGKFDIEAQRAAFTKAKETALALMGDEAQKFLRESMKDFDLWLQAQIEATVNVNKQ